VIVIGMFLAHLRACVEVPMHSSAMCALGLFIAGSVQAQTPPASPPATAAPPPRLERKAELSIVATSGNTDTQSLGAGASLAWRPGTWTTEGRAAFVRSETSNIETARSFAAELRESRALSPRLEGYGRFGYLADPFAGIDHRSTVDAGLGYKLLTGPVHTLRADAGLGYSHEARKLAADRSFALANFGTGYKWQFSTTADLTDAALFTAAFDAADNWRLANVLAVTAAMSRVFSLKLSHDLKFLNAPVPGFEKTDTITSVAFVAKF
jgi:putative salt-induced outer membrane protein